MLRAPNRCASCAADALPPGAANPSLNPQSPPPCWGWGAPKTLAGSDLQTGGGGCIQHHQVLQEGAQVGDHALQRHPQVEDNSAPLAPSPIPAPPLPLGAAPAASADASAGAARPLPPLLQGRLPGGAQKGKSWGGQGREGGRSPRRPPKTHRDPCNAALEWGGGGMANVQLTSAIQPRLEGLGPVIPC